MRLVLRRATRSWGLLLAIAVTALVATAAVTLLADYGRQATQAGWRTVAAAASADERSLLITGSVGAAETDFADRDRSVRAHFASGVGGVPVTTVAAQYGTGRQLLGDLGPVPATPDPVFAAMVALPDLPGHADLVQGAWPQRGSDPLQVTLPQRVAGVLEVSVGARIALRDRATGRDNEVLVAGIWRPRDADDPFWLLTPGLLSRPDAGSTTSYGPFVLDQQDFARTFAGTTTTAGWVVQPDLAEAGPAGIASARRAVDDSVPDLPATTGLGASATLTTGLDRLADRVVRADAVGRSSLLIPVALVIVLGICVLVWAAALLNGDRSAETNLLRARGADRRRLAGLATGEAALAVTPAAALAPVLTLLILQRLDDGTLSPRLASSSWLIAAAAAAGCLVATLGPAILTRGANLTVRTRPRRWAPAQRAGVDVLLVILAVLAWTQARQYSASLTATGATPRVDPSLAAAPVLGVLAGAAVALRVLPPLTRYAQRLLDRPQWPAAVFGGWQAGRRPHTAQVLLVALAVGASTLAWSLVATVDRSHAAQAAHEVGTDLRVQDADGSVSRAAQLAAVPGVRAVLPAWRDDVRIGTDHTQVSVVAVDAVDNPAVRDMAGRLASRRGDPTGVGLPSGTRRLSGVVRTEVTGTADRPAGTVTGLFTAGNGLAYRIPLATATAGGGPTSFSVDLPPGTGQPIRLVGFDVDAGRLVGAASAHYGVTVTGLRSARPDGTDEPVDLRGGGWTVLAGTTRTTDTQATAAAVHGEAAVALSASRPDEQPPLHFTVLAQRRDLAVAAVVTPQALRALGAEVGQRLPLSLPGAELPIAIVGVVTSVPGDTGPAAILLDLSSAVSRLIYDSGTIRPYPQWWITTDPRQHAGAAAAVAAMTGISVHDRVAVQLAADRDPYWRSTRTGLLIAVCGMLLLALVGCAVDIWVGIRRRAGETAVLHTLGAGPRLLRRAFLIEQGLVAGAGAAAGLGVGVLVSALTVPLVILTPAAERPVPEPALVLPWWPTGAIACGVPAAILALGWIITAAARRGRSAEVLRTDAD